MIGGQGLGPALLTVSTTKSMAPWRPCEGFSMASALMFSAPPPFGATITRTLSPGTMRTWSIAGVLSPVFTRAPIGSATADLRR